MRLSDYIVEYLSDTGISNAFVVTGRGALFLNDALARNQEIIKVFPHHEQSAAFAACAAASLTGAPQAVFVSTGCASTNALTGVLSAWQDNIPMIVISGQNSLEETTAHTKVDIKTYGQQEANILPLVSSITKYSCMVQDPSSIRYHLDRALFEATSGNPGPVWIDVPLDLQNYQVEPSNLIGYEPEISKKQVSLDKIKVLREHLRKANRPVFLIGAGVSSSGAVETLKDFSNEHGVPIVYTHSAVDAVSQDFDNCIGSLGSQGTSRSGAFTVQNSDLLIVLGSRMNSLLTGPDKSKFARSADIFAIDIDITPHKHNGINYADIIEGDIKEILNTLSKSLLLTTGPRSEWLEFCQNLKLKYRRLNEFKSTNEFVDIYDIAHSLPKLMTEDGIFVCDSGFIDVIIPTNAPFKDGQSCVRPVSQGAMGFAIPALVGLGHVTDRVIYCFVGDGSIMFNLQELETIARYNINAKICVINNDMYAVIKRRQKKLFRNRTIGVDTATGLKVPNFKKIAQAFGIQYTACTPDNYEEIIKESGTTVGPQIIEIPGKPEQEYIELYHAKTAQRKFVRRPLEDQKPFLPREEFLSNMLIDVIDQ